MDLLRVLVAMAGSFGLLVLSGIAMKWGFGHALLEPWMIETSKAAQQGRWLEAEVVAHGRPQLERAVAWHDRADGHELMGHYHLAAARIANGSQEEFRKAVSSFETAISVRPSMPYSWANLAAAKYRLGEVDGRFYQALETAQRLGPWERPVQALVAEYGLAVLDEASPEVQKAILENVQRGMVYQGDLMLSLARKRGKLARVCTLNVQEKYRDSCVASNVEKSGG